LLQNTDPSHPDYPNLAKALGEVEEIVTYVNEGKRQAEKSQKILEIALATEGGEVMFFSPSSRLSRLSLSSLSRLSLVSLSLLSSYVWT